MEPGPFSSEDDSSRVLYDYYFSLSDREIRITLKNGESLTGVIIAFCFGEEHEKHVTRWHLVERKDKMTAGFGSFGFLIGSLVNHDDIDQIVFLQSNTIMRFNK